MLEAFRTSLGMAAAAEEPPLFLSIIFFHLASMESYFSDSITEWAAIRKGGVLLIYIIGMAAAWPGPDAAARMTRILLPFFLLALAACSAHGPAARRGGDVYPDFAALKAANTEGLDYTREAYFRGSKVAIFAPHGGDIERPTSLLARRTAGRDLNLYIFNGWHGPKGDLHVTSARFDDPEAVLIATSSLLGVSFHGQADRGSWVCVGGANKAAAQLLTRRLEEAGFAAVTPCQRLPGASAKNLVNRPAAGGVQLEITLRLLSRLEREEEELAKFTEAVRRAALEYVSAGQSAAIQETKE